MSDNITTRAEIIDELNGDTPIVQAQQQILANWVSDMIANRLVVTPVEDTVIKVARIRGIKSVVVQGVTEAEIASAMMTELENLGRRTLAAGNPLPRFTSPPPTVSEDVAKCLVHSRVKGLLKTRSKSWGARREKLPPHIMAALLADFDQLLTRHACQIESA